MTLEKRHDMNIVSHENIIVADVVEKVVEYSLNTINNCNMFRDLESCLIFAFITSGEGMTPEMRLKFQPQIRHKNEKQKNMKND